MDYTELDEEEKKRRKEQQIIWRTKKKNSGLFMFATSVFEIIVTLIIILLMFCISAFFIFRVFNAGDTKAGAVVFEILTFASFFGGMYLGFILYKAAARWAIKKFNLEDKLMDDLLMHYKKFTKEEKEAMKAEKMRR